MFERFTDRARRVVVYAQEEARLLNHDCIGTEHLLLGIIREEEGVAAKALTELGISIDDVRSDVIETIGEGTTVPTGHIPFTPRAKKVLELSLREALQLGHNYIGTEHLLLGLVHERQGVAAQILVKRGAQLDRVRAQVVGLLSGFTPAAARAGAPEAERLPEGGPFIAPEALIVEGSAPAVDPRCPRCRSELKDTVGYRVLEVEPVDGEGDSRAVAFAFCRRCGTSYGALS